MRRSWLVIRKAGVAGYLLHSPNFPSLSREAKLWRFIRRRLIHSPKPFSFFSFRTAADAICTELQDEKKATYKYLSISGSEYSWNHCGEEKKKALLGNTATNDEAESTLGGTTANIQRFGRIALSSAGAVSDMNRNAFLRRDAIPTKKNQTVKPSGLFCQFPHELRQ